MWEPQPPGVLRACPGLYRGCYTCTIRAVLVITRCSATTFYSEGPKRFVLAILLQSFIQQMMDVLWDMRFSGSVDEDSGLLGYYVHDLLDSEDGGSSLSRSL